MLILVCFVMGLVALTRPARVGVAWLEKIFLSKIPGYVFLKGAGESALGLEKDAPYPLLLARIEDSWQFGFLIERLEGGNLAVYVPGAPNPLSGSVYYMSPERVRATDIPVATALKCLRQLGAGSQDAVPRSGTCCAIWASETGAPPAGPSTDALPRMPGSA